MGINHRIENAGDVGQVADEAASTGRRNLPLSDTALVLLSASANRDDGSILPPPADLKARGGALKAVLNHLLGRGLVEEMPAGSDAESWRRDEEAGRIGLRITPAGYAAIGVEAVGDGPAVPDPDQLTGDGAAPDLAAEISGSGLDGAVRRGDETEVVDDDPLDGTITWTDVGADPVAPESDSSVGRAPMGIATPRSPSKQDQVIALLSREEGATIEALMAATGWLPHTVRAVLSGLRKKGHRINRRKDGDAGSVYRILPSAKVEAAPPTTGETV